MSKELMTVNDVITIYSERFKDTEIAQVLNKHGKEKMTDKIISNFLFMARKNAKDVPTWKKASVVEALIKCAQWELIPDGIQAALVPFKGELTFLPMYQGMLEVAYRTGMFKSIAANIVYEGDLFEYDLGGACYVKHQLDLTGKRDKPIAVYSDMMLANGGRIVRVMTMSEVNKIKNAAKTQKVWAPYFDAMAIKTVVKQGFKFCPKSEELSSLVAYDNSLEQDFDRGIDTTKATGLNSLLGLTPADQLSEPEESQVVSASPHPEVEQNEEVSDVDLDLAIEAENNANES